MSETTFRDLKLDEVKKLIDDGYEVVDVREDWEWQRGHVPGAQHRVLPHYGPLTFGQRAGLQ